MRARKPRCPYCGAKQNYVKSWMLKRRGEFICPKCGGLSNVRLDPLLYRIGILALVISAGFFVAGWIAGSLVSAIWAVPGTVLPILLFFLVSVFFVRLKKPAPPRPSGGPVQPGGRPAAQQTPPPADPFPPARPPVPPR